MQKILKPTSVIFLRNIVVAHIVGLLGALTFLFLDLPLPWLMGPILACLCASVMRVPMRSIAPLNNFMRTILGVAVGATITPSLLYSVPNMWPTLMIIVFMTLCIGGSGIAYFTLIWKYDHATSYFSSMPGGLQDMLALGEEAGANLRALSLIHATRVLFIVVTLPFLLRSLWGINLDNPVGEAATDIPMIEIILMAVCGIVGWQGAKFFGMFGASILGPLILAALLSLSDILHHRPPQEAIWMAQFFIGMTISMNYSGVTVSELRKDVFAGMGFCLILLCITTPFIALISHGNLAPSLETLLAFTPGGQAELTVLALIAGADMSFVITHHVLRIFLVIFGAPIFAKYLVFISQRRHRKISSSNDSPP